MSKNKVIISVFALLAVFAASACSGKHTSNVDKVDPTIGGVGLILQPTRPTVHVPNSMMRSYPMKDDQLDDRIHYFPLCMTSHRTHYAFRFLPVSGTENLWDKMFVLADETCTPYCYEAVEQLSDNRVGFTAARHSAMFRCSFNQEGAVRIGIHNSDGFVDVDGITASGEDTFGGVKAYFWGEFSTAPSSVEYKDAGHSQALLHFPAGGEVFFRYGMSYISAEQARANLEKEIEGFDFAAVSAACRSVWDSRLSLIEAEGGTEAQQRVFYTALYRCFERMVDISEYGRYYSAFDNQVHTDEGPFYVDNWLWDLYLAHQPLQMIINPQIVEDGIDSYAKMYSQCGWMPNFAVAFGDWPAMTGNNAAIWMQDAWAKGIRDFDFNTMYEGVRKGSLEATMIPWQNGPASELDVFFNEHGWMPGLYPGETETVPQVEPAWERRQCVSVTIDNSYSDWCISQLAAFKGDDADVELFGRRAAFYRNVFREDKGFVWPKDREGNWIEPYNPSLADRNYFTEVNAYTFNWCAKHDIKGLVQLMGGREKAEEKLDELFRTGLGVSKFQFWAIQPDASGLVGQYVMGNEPDFHIPYLYNYLGAPWKTQNRVRMLLDTWFTDNLFGMPGDEDGGGMSAFVVFSMMGFYPVVPGIPVYCIASPVFDKVEVTLPDGGRFKVVARNNSADNKYIQKAWFNGDPLERSWFTHEDLMAGGCLELEMGPDPNLEWGAAAELLPPSDIEYEVY